MKSDTFLLTAVEAIRSVLPDNCGPVALHEPLFAGREWTCVKECLDSGWVASSGPYVNRFENELVTLTGTGFAVAVVNGTAALHLALLAAGVSPGEEVLVPTLTFVATANAIAYCGAVPHFVDSDGLTLGVDPDKLTCYMEKAALLTPEGCFNRQSGRRIRALIVMHTFGHPVDLDALAEVCERYHLEMVEDAAEALGSFYKERHVGNWGRVAALSFNGNKIVTTGGGGAVLTMDQSTAEYVRHLSTQAKIPHPWLFLHDRTAFNYRMPNLNAALGCAQLEQLPDFLTRKRHLAQRYQQAFAGMKGATVFREAPWARSNYWLNALILDEDQADRRDDLIRLAHDNGLMVRPVWTLMHTLPMYKDCPRMDLSTAEGLQRRIINLPSSAFLAPPFTLPVAGAYNTEQNPA